MNDIEEMKKCFYALQPFTRYSISIFWKVRYWLVITYLDHSNTNYGTILMPFFRQHTQEWK